jgi:hypothetical protein
MYWGARPKPLVTVEARAAEKVGGVPLISQTIKDPAEPEVVVGVCAVGSDTPAYFQNDVQ